MPSPRVSYCVSFTSSMTGKPVCLSENSPRALTMYVCGVTPYDDAHIGHGRCYVTFDIVYRLLQFLGFEVRYCRNVTDIDDKLLNRAQAEYGDAQRYPEIAQKFTARFYEDVTQLGCLRPTYEPLVTDHIAEIITCVEALIAEGHAYEAKGSVYFRIDSYPSYGTLSKQKIAEMRAGARVEPHEEKRDPLDFALWKAEPAGTFWQSPWGWGRPGWHIECSALALKYLGAPVDLHGGGMDLMFPHHENERAQSECITHTPFVNLWMHNAFVRVKQEKMSKSLGNFVTLRQAFDRVHPMVLRYYYSVHHYRSPLDFSWDDIAAAEKAYRKIVHMLNPQAQLFGESREHYFAAVARDLEKLSASGREIFDNVVCALTDDLNVQAALAILFEKTAEIKAEPFLTMLLAYVVHAVIGFDLQPLPEAVVDMTPEIEALLEERKQARLQKNWKRADEIRAELIARNVPVRDEKS